MPQPKARNWQPVGLGDSPIIRLYPDKMLNKCILKHLRVRDARMRRGIREELIKILETLWLGLYYRGRPTGGSKLAALSSVEKTLREAYGAVATLDADSRRLTEEQLGKRKKLDAYFPPMDWAYPSEGVAKLDTDSRRLGDAIFRDNKGNFVFRDAEGDIRLSFWSHSTAALHYSIKKVMRSIEPSDPGRKGAAERDAIISLRNMMQASRRDRSDPSHEDLTSFVDDLLAPLRSIELLKGSMAGHIHKALTKLP
jgi:hypothetical protein